MREINPSPIKPWHLIALAVIVVLALTCSGYLEGAS